MKYTDEFLKKVSEKYLYEKTSLTQLQREFSIDRRTLSKKFKEMGINIINNQNILKFNENIFDEVNTEEKAYWLGFIFADGYISSSSCKYKNVFEMSLCLTDIAHLHKFNKFMGHIKNNVKSDNYRCRWNIMNSHLWEVLNNYGCVPNKSLILKFPHNVFKNPDLVRHFIRGYFDGDGCISYYKNKHIISPRISIIGTKNFLNEIIEMSNISAKFKHDKRHSEKTFSLEYTKENSIKMLNWLYSDCTIYLDRKYKRYNFFKNGSRSIQEWNELSLTKNGEDCDVNTVVTEETKESSALYSVEIETTIVE